MKCSGGISTRNNSAVKQEMEMAKRRQEIECELLQIEVDVWLELNKEQEARFDAERHQLVSEGVR